MIDKFRGKYYFLSNFYREDPTFTNEHRFQAMKTLDINERLEVLMTLTPAEARNIGKRVTLRPDWEDIKDQMMEMTLRIKFEDPELRQRLIDTGDEELVEGNWWGDEYWGVNLTTGKGKNILGKLLMKLREEYRHA